jgi:hypothetical protein
MRRKIKLRRGYVNKKKENHDSSGASIDRNAPIGVFNFAASYRAAADLLAKQALKGRHPSDPISSPYCHAAALYLAAFLRLQKVSMSKLRGIGHDFIKPGVRSQLKGLVIDSKTNEISGLLAASGARRRAQYREVGMLAVFVIEERGRGCQRLHKSVGEALAAAGLTVREPSSKKALTSRSVLGANHRRLGIGCRSAGSSRSIERNRRPIRMKERHSLRWVGCSVACGPGSGFEGLRHGWAR